jgi:hypothetical protein
MKRLMLTFALAVAVLGILASPVLAGPTAPTSYPPTNIPIMLPAFGDGVWGFSPSLSVSDISLYQACVRGRDFKPIPVGTGVIVCMGWLGSIYGQVANVPHIVATTIDITGPYGYHRHFEPADTAPYWTGVHAWDEWWTEWLGGPPPELINPACQAGVFWNHLYVPVDAFPAAGVYHLSLTQVLMQPGIDLIPWMEDQSGPLHLTSEFVDWGTEFDFVVGR